ncbi:MAG: hypothetical protein ACNI26_06060 [Terasakiella sp.]|uniref:hypothetical protein n=1 Tax=unclassified Terasakiella TaxID=2614952 RepID=UPI003B004D45
MPVTQQIPPYNGDNPGVMIGLAEMPKYMEFLMKMHVEKSGQEWVKPVSKGS